MGASDRFADDLARLTNPDDRIGLAVSGGPDSLALLLLAQKVAPDRIEVATVDHGLRPEATDEAAFVASLCAARGIVHHTLAARWQDGKPQSNVQAQAREKRYELLARWAADEGLMTIATAHHRDDVIETFLMRALRGAGAPGLAAMPRKRVLRDGIMLIRPLLDWSRAELESLVADAGIQPVEDPSNRDSSYDRARLREALSRADLGNLAQIAASASHLREAEDALDWTTAHLAQDRLTETENGWAVDHATVPRDLLRRLLLVGFERLGDRPPRGPDLARAMETLENGGKCVLGATLLEAEGDLWSLSPAPARNA